MKYLFGITLCMMIFSCYGPIAECRFDCVPVLLNGKVIDKESNNPIPGIKVELTINYTFNAGDRIRVLKKFKTDQDGKFNLVYRLDTNILAVNSYMHLVIQDEKYELHYGDTSFKYGAMHNRYKPTAFVDVTLPLDLK